MNLGILLSIGGSLSDYKKNGQLERLIFYLESYKKIFEKIYIFSYINENFTLPDRCYLIQNKYKIHRFLYSFLMPIIKINTIKKCNILRVTQLTGSTPGVISKILFNLPYIATYGFDYADFAKIEGQKVISYLFNLVKPIWIKYAEKIIVTNKHVLNINSNKLIYIPNGVNTDIFKPTKGKNFTDKIKILFVGRLAKQKNLETLINAVDESLNKTRIRLTFIGEGPEKEKLLKLANSLNVKLQILPFTPLNLLPKFYQESHIFVLPSLIEGHPKVILEAASCGLPIIASSTQGINEIIIDSKSGLLAKPGDAGDFASKIDLLISDQALYLKIRNNAIKNINKNYSLSTLLEKESVMLKNYAKV